MVSSRVLYHATPYSNLGSVLCDGLKANNLEGVVYLCETPQECLRFMFVRGVFDVLTVAVTLPDNAVFETFDHNEKFFKCKCYGHAGNIPAEALSGFTRWNLGDCVRRAGVEKEEGVKEDS